MEQSRYPEGFSISGGEMDGGVECESGACACDGSGRTEQQSKAFNFLVDPCSPTGHKHWIAFERMRLQIRVIK